ncbi:hypothetical protein BG004_001387 [Podila humilis]|nr:hypothetical protein BG004_001387 [Podila humilis]
MGGPPPLAASATVSKTPGSLPSERPSNRASTASVTVSVNSSLHSSAIPPIPSSTSTSVTSIASIASIPSITSIDSTSTITPSTASRGTILQKVHDGRGQGTTPSSSTATARGASAPSPALALSSAPPPPSILGKQRVAMSAPRPTSPIPNMNNNAKVDSKLSSFRSRFTKSSNSNSNSNNNPTPSTVVNSSKHLNSLNNNSRSSTANTSATSNNILAVASVAVPSSSPSTSTTAAVGSSTMALPLSLPSFDDFDLMPFLDNNASPDIASKHAGVSSPTSLSPSPSPSSLSSLSSPADLPSSLLHALTSSPSTAATSPASHPIFSPSSFSPSNSQFLTSQSTRVHDYKGPVSRSSTQHTSPPSTHSSRTPSMLTKATTFDASGPLDLANLEAKDYFIHNKDHDHDHAHDHDNNNDEQCQSNKRAISSFRRPPSSITDKENNDTALLPLSDRGRGRKSPSDDLLAPPRFVIRQPSLSNMSKTSRATSPSPSMASSVISNESSIHPSPHYQPHRTPSIHQVQHQQQPSFERERTRKTSSARSPQSSIIFQAPSRTSIVSLPEHRRSTLSTASSDRIPTSSSPSSHPSSPLPPSLSASPTPGSKRVTVLKGYKSQGEDSDSPQRSPSPNLRSRLSRLFRQSPKSERVGPVLDQRYRAEQQRLYQESLRSNAAMSAKASGQASVSSATGRATTTTATATAVAAPGRPSPIHGPCVMAPSTATAQGDSKVQQTLQPQPSIPRPMSAPALQFNIEEEEVVDDYEDDLQIAISKSHRSQSEAQSPQALQPALEQAHVQRTNNAPTHGNNLPHLFIPQTSFASGVSPSPPSSPMSRNAPGNKARQRRVSSVSSSHSIRQFGSYGVSPARKANPYYSGVIARFSHGNNKLSLHERDLSQSSLRRSNIILGTDLPRKEILESTKPLSIDGVESTQSKNDGPETVEASTDQKSLTTSQPSPPPPLMFSATYEEEYNVEKDESARNSVQGSPFQSLSRNPYGENSAGRNLFNSRLLAPSMTIEQTAGGLSPADSDQCQQSEDSTLDQEIHELQQQHPSQPQEAQQQFRQSRTALPSPDTTWSTATGALTDVGTIPDSLASSYRQDSVHQRGIDSSDSQATEATPSISTLSSAQVTSEYQDHSMIQSEDHWDDSSSIQDRRSSHPIVTVQRPSTDLSILLERPFARTKPMSKPSSMQSGISHKPAQSQQPTRIMSVAQWSESSYDPCAPIRWDELFEMDPNSKGPLWLSNRSLGQIPHEFFDGLRNLRELYLDHNDIKIVPDSLLKLTKLDVLDLSCNSISSFHSAFKMKKLKNLRRLNLDQNMLTDISPIYKLKSLRELRLNHNFVGHLAIAIQHMTKLKILTMESNSLVTLPETMGKLGNLCELRLSDNNLRALPESIGSIRTLQVLALRSNLLEKLPESWKDMENLTTLDLSCNRLTHLPQDLVRIPKLTHLDLHDNQIQLLPEKIGQLSNLVVLHLCSNHLRELPKDIGRLRDLNELVLSYNFLQVLPDEIGKLNKLQELKFDNNPLRSLPKTIQRLTHVRRVHLQGCALRELPVELGVAFKDLIYLDLSGNQFEVMPALDQMYKLEEFYISNNFLREIGTSLLNLSNSTSSNVSASNNNNYNTGTLSGPMGGGLGMPNHAHIGSGSMSQADGIRSGGGANSLGVGGNGSLGGSVMGSGGVTASKLSDLKRLRIFEAHHNQIRVLSSKIKIFRHLEVLDLSDNLLSWLPKEVGDLADLKVLLLKGNPIKSLPSSLTKLMGSLEVFRIGEWPENGFEISREQTHMNMKINVLQSFMPQQIERTLLWRMHDSILKRVQELDSQKYRDQHDLDSVTGAGPLSRALTAGHSSLNGTGIALSSTTANILGGAGIGKPQLSITQGLAIATQNMMVNRSFALPPVPGGERGSVTPASSIEQSSSTGTSSELQTLNSEGIHPNHVEYSSTGPRTLPTLQFTAATKYNLAPITSTSLTTSPVSASGANGTLSAFPLLNSLRSRKSHQQLSTMRNGSVGLNAGVRPKSMYTQATSYQQEEQQHHHHHQQQHQQQQHQILQKLNNRMSRVFDFATGSKSGFDHSTRGSSTLESSMLQLSTDAMMALGLETHPGSAGSVITHSNSAGRERVSFGRARLGDGNLLDLKHSMAIKSSPSLSYTPLSLIGARPTSPPPGFAPNNNNKNNNNNSNSNNLGPRSNSRSSSAKITKTSFGRPASPIPGHVYSNMTSSAGSSRSGGGDKSSTSLPWLRLKSSTTTSPTQENLQHQLQSSLDEYSGRPTGTGQHSASNSLSTPSSSLLLRQPSLTESLLNAPTPPPILLNYDLDTDASLDIPSHMYYSAGGDDVDGDKPVGEDGESVHGDGLGIDGESDNEEEEDDQSTTTGGGRSSSKRNRRRRSTREQEEEQQQQQQNQLNSTDPVLKIAVLKGIYDQILHNMDTIAEHHIQESPAKKNNRFKLLNSLRFLKSQNSNSSSSGGGGGAGGGSGGGSGSGNNGNVYQQHHNSHGGIMAVPLGGHYPMTTTL